MPEVTEKVDKMTIWLFLYLEKLLKPSLSHKAKIPLIAVSPWNGIAKGHN